MLFLYLVSCLLLPLLGQMQGGNSHIKRAVLHLWASGQPLTLWHH
jgi:hypothetical protein